MISAILLAAGRSKRIKGQNKLSKKFKGKPLINHILKSLIKKKINVSRATLYRTIDVFVKHNLLKKVSLANGKILYEHNKKSINPKHDHILCEDCGEIFEFFDHNITVLENEIAKKLNMKVTQRTHQLSGVCNSQNCSHLTN